MVSEASLEEWWQSLSDDQRALAVRFAKTRHFTAEDWKSFVDSGRDIPAWKWLFGEHNEPTFALLSKAREFILGKLRAQPSTEVAET